MCTDQNRLDGFEQSSSGVRYIKYVYTSLTHSLRWLLQRPSSVIQQLAHLLTLSVKVLWRLSDAILSTGWDLKDFPTSVAVAQQGLERLDQPFHWSQQVLLFQFIVERCRRNICSDDVR